jgi:hypothetical protein
MSVEQLTRDYLRTDETLMGLLNGDEKRLNMEWSGDLRASHVTLYRAGGNMDDYLPHDHPVIAIHCYGSTRPAAADLAEASALAMRRLTQADDPLLSASVESINYLPTPEGVARYVITTVVVAQLAPVA